MTSLLETLGITSDPSTPVTEPIVVTATITSVSPDVALVVTADAREAVLPISEWYPNRRWQVGDVHQMLLMETTGRPVVSTVRPELVEALYHGLVPELLSGQVRIMSIARSAGLRSKVAVASTGGTADPVAAMIGREANRVKLISSLLEGERIDIVAWSPDTQVYLKNALAPARVSRVVITDRGATAFAPAHQMSAAVGSAGLNSQLAGQLIGLPVVVAVEDASGETR